MEFENAWVEYKRREESRLLPSALPFTFFRYKEKADCKFDAMVINGRHRNMFVENPALLPKRLQRAYHAPPLDVLENHFRAMRLSRSLNGS